MVTLGQGRRPDPLAFAKGAVFHLPSEWEPGPERRGLANQPWTAGRVHLRVRFALSPSHDAKEPDLLLITQMGSVTFPEQNVHCGSDPLLGLMRVGTRDLLAGTPDDQCDVGSGLWWLYLFIFNYKCKRIADNEIHTAWPQTALNCSKAEETSRCFPIIFCKYVGHGCYVLITLVIFILPFRQMMLSLLLLL